MEVAFSANGMQSDYAVHRYAMITTRTILA